MAFSQVEILDEFAEAARTVTDWAAAQEEEMYRRRLQMLQASRERNARWYSDPANVARKLAYMREYNALKHPSRRSRLPPESLAAKRARDVAYRASERGKALTRAWLSRRSKDPAWIEKESKRNKEFFAANREAINKRRREAYHARVNPNRAAV